MVRQVQQETGRRGGGTAKVGCCREPSKASRSPTRQARRCAASSSPSSRSSELMGQIASATGKQSPGLRPRCSDRESDMNAATTQVTHRGERAGGRNAKQIRVGHGEHQEGDEPGRLLDDASRPRAGRQVRLAVENINRDRLPGGHRDPGAGEGQPADRPALGREDERHDAAGRPHATAEQKGAGSCVVRAMENISEICCATTSAPRQEMSEATANLGPAGRRTSAAWSRCSGSKAK